MANVTPSSGITELALTQFDYNQCRHLKLWRAGFNAVTRKQRLKCSYCRKYFTVNSRADRLMRIRVVAQHFLAGVSIRRTVRFTGYTKETVRKYYQLLTEFQSRKRAI